MSADPNKYVTNSLPEFLLLASVTTLDGNAMAATGCLRAVTVCYEPQSPYTCHETVTARRAELVALDEFTSYCDSKIQRHFADTADRYRCCMTVSDLIRMDPWIRLYDRIGPWLMRYLLFDCLLIVPVQRDAYYCVRTSYRNSGHYEALRQSFWTAAVNNVRKNATMAKNVQENSAAAPKNVRGNSTAAANNVRGNSMAMPVYFNLIDVLTHGATSISLPAEADDMFRGIVDALGEVSGPGYGPCLDVLKRKLHVIAGRDSAPTYKAIYRDVVGDVAAADEVPLSRVKKFAAAVVRKVVPRELFGINQNRDRYCENLCMLLNGGKTHVFTAQHVVHKIKVAKLRWLDGAPDAGRRVTIMTATMMWLTLEFVFRRIARHFQIVATNTPNGGVAYFGKAGWASACFAKISPLMDGNKFFREVPAPQNSSYRHWKVCPYAKANGIRLIFKLQQRETGAEKRLTDDCLMFLRCLTRTYPAEFRSVSRPQLFGDWRTFRECRTGSGRSSPVYYVRTDFKDAFTSIKQGKLLAVVRHQIERCFGNVWSRMEIDVHSVNAVSVVCDGSVYNKRIKYVDHLPEPDFPGGSLLFYQETTALSLTRIWDAVQAHVRRNAVRLGGRRWAVTRGLVQGDRLSVVLCDLLLADLQATHLKHLQADGSRVFRFVDDHVFVSSDRTAALRFLAAMSVGFSEYGLELNWSKTQTNLVASADGTFRFLGYRLNAITGEVIKDMTSYRNRRPLHYFDYGLGRGHPGRTLYTKVARVNQRGVVPPMLVSRAFNSVGSAARNLASTVAYKAFAVVTAIKQYFLHLNPAFVSKTIHAIVRLVYAKARCLAQVAAITPMQCKWIAYEVYARMFHSHFCATDHRILWILDQVRELQTATARKCNTADLKTALRRHNFTKIFG